MCTGKGKYPGLLKSMLELFDLVRKRVSNLHLEGMCMYKGITQGRSRNAESKSAS